MGWAVIHCYNIRKTDLRNSMNLTFMWSLAYQDSAHAMAQLIEEAKCPAARVDDGTQDG